MRPTASIHRNSSPANLAKVVNNGKRSRARTPAKIPAASKKDVPTLNHNPSEGINSNRVDRAIHKSSFEAEC